MQPKPGPLGSSMNWCEEAHKRGVRIPTEATVRRYGLTQTEWCILLARQGWRCPVCLKSKATWNTDHEHVAGWARMKPEVRKTFVRGVLCWHCNHKKVHSTMQSDEVERIAAYLSSYESRRAS